MTRNHVIAASAVAIAVAAVAVAAAVTLNSPGETASSGAQTQGPVTPSASGAATPGGTSAPSTSEPLTPKNTPDPDPNPDPDPDPAPSLAPTDRGSGWPTQAPTPGTEVISSLPPSEPLKPLLTGSPPESATANGSMVPGFPSAIPVAPKSVLGTTSVTSSDGIVQAGLDATTPDSTQDVVMFYQTAFGKLGLASSPSASVGGSTAVSFARGADAITLTVTATRQGSEYTVFAVLGSAG
jgi:hypothetical protein